MKLAIITDAWKPQINGVVRTLSTISRTLRALDHEVRLITPDQFHNVPCPTYSEIRLAVLPARKVRRLLRDFAPDAIHIATEGPLGQAARRYCLDGGFAFTTSFHTRFPEYLAPRFGVPLDWSYAFLRRFHAPAVHTMVPTPSIADELSARGFSNLVLWGRGVDTELFKPDPEARLPGDAPIWLYVGRIAVEKNIEAFLDLDLPGTKHVIGEGPLLAKLRKRYPEVRFPGPRFGADLARTYAGADVFVFPSCTDTFGNVMLEALASGTPVAAYPVPGPRDVLGASAAAALREDLRAAALRALRIDRAQCREFACGFSWEASALQFASHLALVDSSRSAA